jgi:hypothetical protein
MESIPVVQGRLMPEEEIRKIQDLIAAHPDWSRNRLSIELAQTWNWRTPTGRLKDMASISLLLKMERRGWIVLPPRRHAAPRRLPRHPELPLGEENGCSINSPLSELTPLVFEKVRANHPRFSRYLVHEHYLGYRGSVGEHLAYLIGDRHGRDLACMLFGSAAWKVVARDRYIGWDPALRAQRLQFMTNNTRFLIRKGVVVPHLASHILGRIIRRLSDDWQAKYGHPIHMLETFVQKDRFLGTSYKAAGWTYMGDTQGRGRGDPYHKVRAPIKSIWIKPLCQDFRRKLCGSEAEP